MSAFTGHPSKTCSAGREDWVVAVFRANYSAFNGYRRTPSDYSLVRCEKCGFSWRTKAAYVDTLRHEP